MAYLSSNCFNRTNLGKCARLYDETQGTMKHKRFPQKVVFVRCKEIIIKEEGNKQEDRQGVDVK